MQAIVTKYLSATNSRGSRVKASCQSGSITLSWDDALNSDGNHEAACLALREKLGWSEDTHGPMVSGALPKGSGNCYVFSGRK